MSNSHNNLNRDRWRGWVMFAWILAALTIISSAAIIAILGQMDVPVVDRFGNARMETRANPIIWGWGIGQSIAALLLAALFSMINSIYQNSCDQLQLSRADGHKNGEESVGKNPAIAPMPGSQGWALKVNQVNESSPFHGVLHDGCVLLSINGTPTNNTKQAATLVVDGDNIIEIKNASGERIKKKVSMKPGPLGIKAEAVPSS